MCDIDSSSSLLLCSSVVFVRFVPLLFSVVLGEEGRGNSGSVKSIINVKKRNKKEYINIISIYNFK